MVDNVLAPGALVQTVEEIEEILLLSVGFDVRKELGGQLRHVGRICILTAAKHEVILPEGGVNLAIFKAYLLSNGPILKSKSGRVEDGENCSIVGQAD